VDAEDYPLLSRHNWHLLPSNNHLYAYAPIHVGRGIRKMISMTHMIMGSFYHVDHADQDTINNQKYNLRGATWQQNQWNKGKTSTTRGRKPTSKYKGVSYCPLREVPRWRVQIKHVPEGAPPRQGKYIVVGYFFNEDDAGRAYNKKIVELRGKWAWQNPVPEISNVQEPCK
jgi:hypothetical protein